MGSTILPWVVLALLAMILGCMGYIDHLQDRVEMLVTERHEAVADKAAADKAVLELAVERAAAERRSVVVRDVQPEILKAQDGQVAPAVWIGLRAADRTGGIE